jgi:hypothetical protein
VAFQALGFQDRSNLGVEVDATLIRTQRGRR